MNCRIDFETQVGAKITDEEWNRIEKDFTSVVETSERAGIDRKRVIARLKDQEPTQAATAVMAFVDKIVQREAKVVARRAERLVKSEEKFQSIRDRIERESTKRKLTKIEVLNEHLYNEVGGAGDNLELMQRSYQATWAGALDKKLHEITRGRFYRLIRNRGFRLEVIREYDRIHKGQPRVTQDDQIFGIAKALHETRNAQRATLNRLGSRRTWQAAGLPMRWSWSRIRGSRDEFVRVLSEALDAKTHGDDLKRQTIARSIYDRLDQSHGILDFDRLGEVLGDDTAPVLEWARGDAWISLNDRFGDDDFIATAMKEIEHLAAKEATMRKFGPTADQTFQRLLKAAGKDGAHSKVKRAEARYEMMTKTFIPESVTLSRYLGAARNTMTFSKMGSTIFMSLVDPVVSMYRMKMFHNAGLFRQLSHMFDGLKGEHRDHAKWLGTWAEGMNAYVARRFGEGSELDDKVSRGTSVLADMIMRIQGQQFWTGWNKAGTTAVVEANLGDYIRRKVKFWELPPQLKSQLARFDIGEGEWSRIKPRHVRRDGRLDVFLMPREEAEGLGLKHKLIAYLIDAVESGIITPGRREQELLGGNAVPGSVWAEIMKTITQFGSFAMTAHNKIIYRTLKDETLPWRAKIAGLSSLMIFATLVNAIGIQAKQVAAGNQPYAWDRNELLQKSLMSLPYGLVLDTFMKVGGDQFAEAATGYEGYNGERNVELLGPVAREIQNFMNGGGMIAKGNTDKGLRKIAQTLLGLPPGQNLWWAMAAYRAGVVDPVTEWVDPKGYRQTKRNLERRAREQRQGGQLRSPLGQALD